MGIFSQLAALLLREHRFRPITGELLTIGRQTIFMTRQQALALVEHELGVKSPVQADSLEVDVATRASTKGEYISDKSFFSLFSDARYHCLDVSNYEGADIVANLCEPLPAHLEGRFDFIVDGSTLDNVFDPAAAIRNLAKLLRPGGRIVQINHAARLHYVYVGFALSWFHDYYAINAFEDCQVYLAQWEGDRTKARWDFYHYEPIREQDGRITFFGQDRYYFPWREAQAVVIAEKGESSTWERSPVQFEYRDNVGHEERRGKRETRHQTLEADAGDPYLTASLRFHRSPRLPLFHPVEKIQLPDNFLHYAPENPYCGSLFPVADHLTRPRSTVTGVASPG
jgi:SAM-dependent methyltransferase